VVHRQHGGIAEHHGPARRGRGCHEIPPVARQLLSQIMSDGAVTPDPTAGSGPAGRRAPGPLAGLLVADFSRILAGPYCTMLLGDLGADVIKVESPEGDDTRRWVPPTRDGVAPYYLAINRNKRSVALDLRDAE